MVQAALLESLTPPPRPAVDEAVRQLLSLGALQYTGSLPSPIDDSLTVTPLGRAILALPLEAGLGRLITLALPFGCISDAVAVTAGLPPVMSCHV